MPGSVVRTVPARTFLVDLAASRAMRAGVPRRSQSNLYAWLVWGKHGHMLATRCRWISHLLLPTCPACSQGNYLKREEVSAAAAPELQQRVRQAGAPGRMPCRPGTEEGNVAAGRGSSFASLSGCCPGIWHWTRTQSVWLLAELPCRAAC